jgi:D-beta-D-heptose 7-phosphate kinase/D-beta-D-heptose 1-phosphate adenosyltransferase
VRNEDHNLAALARAFRGRRCLVVGDVMLDVFERGRADKLAPDAPAPVVTDVSRTCSPGGAANVAANLAALGASATLLSVVGDDDPGLELLEKLAEAGVETGAVVREAGRATVVKRRLVADGVTLARVDSGDTHPLRDGAAERFSARARTLAASSDAVVVSDYAGGTVTQVLADALGETGHACVVLDSKSPLRLSWRGLAAATPNHLEAQKALDLPVEADPRRVDAAEVGRSLCRRLGARVVAVTLAEQGAAVAGPGGVESVAGRAVTEPDVNGAGDTFLAAFALALSGGAEAIEAARVGVEAATLAVLKPGTAPVASEELIRHLSDDTTREGDRSTRLEEDLALVRRQGGKVVFTSGRFDPPRRGHLRLLREARGLGDLLVVGLLPDSRERGRQDPSVLPLEDRAEILDALQFVDHVVVLDDEAPAQAAQRLGADLCVVRDEGAVGANGFDGEVVFLPGLPEGSSQNDQRTTVDEAGGSVRKSPAEARL